MSSSELTPAGPCPSHDRGTRTEHYSFMWFLKCHILLCSSDQGKSFPGSIITVLEQPLFSISCPLQRLFFKDMRLILSQTGVYSLTVPRIIFLFPLWVHLCVSNKWAIVIHRTQVYSAHCQTWVLSGLFIVLCPFGPFVGRHKEPVFQHIHFSYQQSGGLLNKTHVLLLFLKNCFCLHRWRRPRQADTFL